MPSCRGTSLYRGVWYDFRKMRWRASIWNGSKDISLGYFEREWDAADAYNEAAKKYHKSDAQLNERITDEDYDGPD